MSGAGRSGAAGRRSVAAAGWLLAALLAAPPRPGAAAELVRPADLAARAEWVDREIRHASPFSFICGGRPSAALLPLWKRMAEEEKLDAARTRDPYTMRSAFVPAYRLGWDARDRGVDLALLRRTVAEFRAIEKFLLGDFYPLAPWSLDEGVWAAWQYDRPEAGEGIVQVFRRAASPYESARLRLRGLDPGAAYRVGDVGGGPTAEAAGRELADPGLLVELPEPRSSRLVRYSRK